MSYHFTYYLYKRGESLERISRKEAEKEVLWIRIKKELDKEKNANKKTN